MSNNYTARLKTLGEKLLDFQCKKKYKGKIYNDCEKVGLLMVSPVTEKLEKLKGDMTIYKDKSLDEKKELIANYFRELYEQNTQNNENTISALKSYIKTKNTSEQEINNILDNEEQLREVLKLIDEKIRVLLDNQDKLKAIYRIFRVFESGSNNKYNMDQTISNLLLDLIRQIIFDEDAKFLDIQYGGYASTGAIILLGGIFIIGLILASPVILGIKTREWWKKRKEKQKEMASQASVQPYPTQSSTTVSIPQPPPPPTSIQNSPVQQSTFQESTFQESPVQQYPYQAF